MAVTDTLYVVLYCGTVMVAVTPLTVVFSGVTLGPVTVTLYSLMVIPPPPVLDGDIHPTSAEPSVLADWFGLSPSGVSGSTENSICKDVLYIPITVVPVASGHDFRSCVGGAVIAVHVTSLPPSREALAIASVIL